MKSAHIFYSGTVQGVGFRYTARHIANKFNITGWVKNLPDGRVEMVCEGKESQVKNFITSINDEFSNYIRDKEIFWSEASGRFNSFSIAI